MEVRRQQTSGSGGESAQGSSTAALNLLMGGTVLRTGAGNREVQHLRRSFLLTGGSLLMEGGCGQDWPPHNRRGSVAVRTGKVTGNLETRRERPGPNLW